MYRIVGNMSCECGGLPCRFSNTVAINDAAKGVHVMTDSVFQELAALLQRSGLPGPLELEIFVAISDLGPFPPEVDTPLFVAKKRYTKHSKPKKKGNRWDCGKGTD